MQERMSANMVDRNEAVQAAETGLQVAHRTVIRGTFNDMWNGSKTFAEVRGGGVAVCTSSRYCDRSDPANDEIPAVPATAAYTVMPNGARYAFTVEFLGLGKGESADVQGVCNTSSAPVYLCARPMFRITSYGRGRGVAQAVLQSNIISQPQ